MAKMIAFDQEARDAMRRGVAEAGPGRQGHARPHGPQRHPPEELRLADRHQGRRDRRQGNRPGRRLREHGRPDGPRSRLEDQRRRRRRHHHRHRSWPKRSSTKASAPSSPASIPIQLKQGIEKAVADITDEAQEDVDHDQEQEGDGPGRHRRRQQRHAKSATCWPRPWKRSARTASSPSTKARAWRPKSSGSKACSSTAATSRPTSSPIRRRWNACSKTPTS